MVSVKKHQTMEGFYEVPGFPMLYINELGIAWDDYFKEYVRPFYSIYPYPQIQSTGSIKPISIHRALALTFLECPGDPSDYQIDHVDGNKENYSLSNLEWVTHSENAIRAFKTGRRNDNRPVLLKDLETDEIHRFHGVNACGRFLGLHPAYICAYLRRPQGVPFREKYEIIREGTPWLGFTKNDIGRHNGNRPKEVVAKNLETREATIYGSTARASECTGVSQSEISNRVTGKVKGPIKGYEFIYLKDFQEETKNLVRIASKRVDNFTKKRYQRRPVPIVVFDTVTGVTSNWDSTDAFANHLGVHKKTVQKSMAVNEGVFKKYQIKYVEANTLPS